MSFLKQLFLKNNNSALKAKLPDRSDPIRSDPIRSPIRSEILSDPQSDPESDPGFVNGRLQCCGVAICVCVCVESQRAVLR